LATVFERIRKVTVEQLGVKEEEVTPSSNFVEELGADSLDLVELIMALEEAFSTPERKITIPDEEAEKILTVQDAMDYLRRLGVNDQEVPKPPPEKSRIGVNLPHPSFHKPGTPHAQPGQSGPKPQGQGQRQQRPQWTAQGGRPQGQRQQQGQGGSQGRPQGQRSPQRPQGGQRPSQPPPGNKPNTPPPNLPAS